jgi:hypothetical protein
MIQIILYALIIINRSYIFKMLNSSNIFWTKYIQRYICKNEQKSVKYKIIEDKWRKRDFAKWFLLIHNKNQTYPTVVSR